MIAAQAHRDAGAPPVEPPASPLVLLCECAGTMANIDFRTLAAGIEHAGGEVRRGCYWCGREGQAELIELLESPQERPLVFAGCAYDFAARRLQKLFARGFAPQVADIREGCSWVHGDDVAAVTEKARRIVVAALTHPDPPADALSHAERENTVLVIGGGVAGTQAAAELAQMNHRVELVERRAFLGGRAARIGTVFPTNDCGQCLPTTDAQAGTRKCFHRNAAIDHPSLGVWRRTTVESGRRPPGSVRRDPSAAAKHRHGRVHRLRRLRGGVSDRIVATGRQVDLRRAVRRSCSENSRPRHVHLLRRLRRRLPG